MTAKKKEPAKKPVAKKTRAEKPTPAPTPVPDGVVRGSDGLYRYTKKDGTESQGYYSRARAVNLFLKEGE